MKKSVRKSILAVALSFSLVLGVTPVAYAHHGGCPQKQPAATCCKQKQPCSQHSLSLSASKSGKKQVVYITKTGTKYHNSWCRTLKKTKIKTTLSKAKSQGYKACKVCQ